MITSFGKDIFVKGLKLMDFKYEAAALIAKACDMDINEIEGFIEIPAKAEMGDYAFPCFRLAKTMKKAPNIIASELCGKINEKIISADDSIIINAVGRMPKRRKW